MSVAGLCDAAKSPVTSAGVLRGSEPEITHQLSGIVEARDITEFRNEGYGRDEGDASEGLDGFHDRSHAPGDDVVTELGLESLTPFMSFLDGADILLEDDLLCRSVADVNADLIFPRSGEVKVTPL
jgi:hypothetical protein